MFRTFICCTAFALVCFARAEEPSVVVQVMSADDRPAVGAKVWVQSTTRDGKKSPEPKPLITDADGRVTIDKSAKPVQYRELFARDSSGRVGFSSLRSEESDTLKTVVLVDTAPKSGRALTIGGKPVIGATVTLLGYYDESNERRSEGGPAASITMPEWEWATQSVKSDADGKLKLPSPKASYSVMFQVSAEGFGETKWIAPPGIELDVTLSDPGTLVIEVAGVEAALLKGLNWRLNRIGTKPGPGVRPILWRIGQLDGTAKVTVPFVAPGRYELEISPDGKFPAVYVKGLAVDVVSGKASAVAAKFGPAVKASGKVTGPDGKGIAGVRVWLNIVDGANRDRRSNALVETDVEGQYTGYGSAGWYSPYLDSIPDGFARPLPPASGRVEEVKIDVGNSYEFPAIALLKAVSLQGRVMLADAKPALGAEIDIGTEFNRRHSGKVKADNDGRFEIPNLPPDDSVSPRVRLGKAVNIPETIVLAQSAPTLVIEIREANAAAFRGRVLDVKGVGIPGAKVGLWQQVPGVGRNSSTSTNRPIAKVMTGAKGEYEFTGMWPGDYYHVEASASNYSTVAEKQLLGVAGMTTDFADVKLARTSLSVGGTVVGSDGKPLAGVELFSNDGPVKFSAKSAADGTFTLTGFSENGGFAFAKLAGYRLGRADVIPGAAQKLKIVLSKSDGVPVPLPEISAEHTAALDRMTRHTLTLVFESHSQFGFGGNAIGDMARYDLATAKRWRDEEKTRTNGRTDFTHLIERAERDSTLFPLAQKDPDAALAVLNALKPEMGFTETIALAKRLLVVDKTKALPFAELAIVLAGRHVLPNRIWCLAWAGDLAQQAGGENIGKKAVADAADLTTKFGVKLQPLEAMAMGIVASHLTPFDSDRARAMLERQPEQRDFNRYLGAAAVRVARTDLTKANELLKEFKVDNSSAPLITRIQIASEIGSEKPEEAIKLIDGIKSEPERVLGYLRLAVRFQSTDKKLAWKMIEAAMESLERDPKSFFSYSNSCGRAGMAAIAAVRAKESGYPHTADLVTRCLAMRSTEPAWNTPDSRDQQTVGLASAIALIDPATARQLLRSLGDRDVYLAKAVGQRREWLFALALADPDSGKKLADKLIDAAKRSPKAPERFGNTGLVELGTILSDPDRLKVLSRFGTLPHEIEEVGDY